MRHGRGWFWVGLVAVALVVTACNPFTMVMGPPSAGYGHWQTNEAPVEVYTGGPPEAWVTVHTPARPGYKIYAFAALPDSTMTGPADRWCGDSAGTGIVACGIDHAHSDGAPFTDPPVLISGDGTARSARVITVWPDEPFVVALVCIDTTTLGRDCPDGYAPEMRAEDWGGNLVGDLGDGYDRIDFESGLADPPWNWPGSDGS